MNDSCLIFNLSHCRRSPTVCSGIAISSGLEMQGAVIERRINLMSNLSNNEIGHVYWAVPNCLKLIETVPTQDERQYSTFVI